MGFPPEVIKRMSLWEYIDCVEGWMKAHDTGRKDDEDNMTPELFRAIMDAPVGGPVRVN